MATFSIVIPTYKRKKHVIALLESLKGKIGRHTEVIVVEQLEKNKLAFEKKAKELHINLRYFYLSKPSTPQAKNVGITHAKGEYVIFFDDDILLQSSIHHFLEPFRNTNVAAINGRVPTVGHKEDLENENVGKVTFLGKFTDGYTSKVPQEIQTVIGCNVCWRKDVLKKLKGFDTQFTGNALREEADLSFRAREKGYRILFDPSVEVFHVRAESGGTRKTEGRIQWYFDFFSNETYFFLKHWPFWSVPFVMVTRWEWALRCMFGFGREVSIRSNVTPFAGIVDGYKKYRRWRHENRN